VYEEIEEQCVAKVRLAIFIWHGNVTAFVSFLTQHQTLNSSIYLIDYLIGFPFWMNFNFKSSNNWYLLEEGVHLWHHQYSTTWLAVFC
jgi:hypothetical protein